MGWGRLARGWLKGTFGDLVGYKAGLSLDEDQLASMLDAEYRQYILGDPEEWLWISARQAEDIVAQLLYGVGHTPVRHTIVPVDEVFRRFKGHEAAVRQFQGILSRQRELQRASTCPLRYSSVIDQAREELGELGVEIALINYHMQRVTLEQNPWSGIRRVEWTDIVQLDDLFRSESLYTSQGGYIDQRFIDYLARNFAAVQEMNWRKFEGLTCEYFERLGYHVQISEGRNDGGIDARVWPAAPGPGVPPTVLIQCKRERKKIEKVVVKALWADVVDEGAQSGLIVTTNALSPGAAAVCSARAYPVVEANRETIRTWIEAMRTPHAGVFLGG